MLEGINGPIDAETRVWSEGEEVVVITALLFGAMPYLNVGGS